MIHPFPCELCGESKAEVTLTKHCFLANFQGFLAFSSHV